MITAPPIGFNQIGFRYAPYSASKLLVARCPARFQGKYILKDKVISDSIAAARGSAIHLVLQRMTEAWARREDLSSTLINHWVEEAVGKFPASYEQIKLVKDSALAYASNPPKIIGSDPKCELELAVALCEEDSFLDDVTPATRYIAVPYSIEGYAQNPAAYFTSKIDLLWVDEDLKTVTVLDHKSTPNASHNSDHDFQLGCYAWMASLFYPGYAIRTVLHYAHPGLNFYSPPVLWNTEDLRDVEEEVRMRVRAIESFEEYPALPGSHCTYCHMVQQCPEYLAVDQQDSRGDINLSVHNTQDLIRIARQLTVTGKLYDQLNKCLKEGIESHAPTAGIAVEGMWYGFKAGEQKVDWIATDRKIRDEVERAKLNPEASGNQQLLKMGDLAGMLEQYGVSPEAFKQWRADKLKALWKMDKPELLNVLKDFVVYDRDTRFGGYKI